MNYLQLVQRLRRKCRVAGADPATVQGTLNEEMARLAAWTDEAWRIIQSTEADWFWMRGKAQFQTALGQAEYTLAQIGVADVAKWDEYSFRNYWTAGSQNGELMMSRLSYPEWRDTYQFGAFRTQRTRPIEVCVLPNYGLGLGPTPTAGYTITGEYFKTPQVLAADTDVPSMPAQYHDAIVYRAMMFYGASEAAAEVYQEGEAEYRRMLARMMARETHGFALPGALA